MNGCFSRNAQKDTCLSTVKERKTTHFGHIMWEKDKCIEKEIIQCTSPGVRSRGIPKTNCMVGQYQTFVGADNGRTVEDG